MRTVTLNFVEVFDGEEQREYHFFDEKGTMHYLSMVKNSLTDRTWNVNVDNGCGVEISVYNDPDNIAQDVANNFQEGKWIL